jgi:hypothetical protein
VRSRTLVFGLILGGIACGAVGSVFVSSWLSPPKVEQRLSGNSKTPALPAAESYVQTERLGSAVRGVDNRLSEMAERLAKLEEQGDKPPQVDPGAPASDDPNPQENAAVSFERSLEKHQAEPRDEVWAKATETTLLADFSALKSSIHAEVKDVTCRNTTCAATLEWPDRRSALDHWQTALTGVTRAGCGREVVVPEGKPGETKITAKVLFDCESWRAEGSQLLTEEALAALQLPQPTQ